VTTFDFSLQARDGRGRAGIFNTPHGPLSTPVFAPVGTQATVKALTPEQLESLGARLILANTYHLYLRPGDQLIARMGGLHDFMRWDGPILTDSGGYQVFSLADRRSVDADGVTFRSHLDGAEHRLTPEKTIAIQENLGADIIMTLDVCPAPDDRPAVELATERTHAWAERCLAAHTRDDQALFGIVQGGVFDDLRRQSAAFISDLGFAGIGIGGLSVGESKAETLAALELLDEILPDDRPRYLMGVGSPDDLVEGVMRGVDMFDCVLPTRMARNHSALTRTGRLNMRRADYAEDSRPIDPDCECYTCRNFSRSYLRHLSVAGEMLAATLLSIHNLFSLISLMGDLRQAILDSRLEAFAQAFRHEYRKHRPLEV
jgi:queuine tRNA-ribosyltransferase